MPSCTGAAEDHPDGVRGQDGRSLHQRVLHHLHGQPAAQVQEVRRAVQREQGQNVRRAVAVSPLAHQAVARLLSHARRAQDDVPQRVVHRRPLQDHEERRGRMVEEVFSGQVRRMIKFSIQ